MNFWISLRWASRSDEISIRPLKSSGRTSFAICAKSCGLLMSCLGNFMPPFGHSTIAFWSASSSVGAQDRCSWPMNRNVSGSLPDLAAAFAALLEDHLDLLLGRADGDQAVRVHARSSWP